MTASDITPERIAADLLRQELARMRARIAFFHGCSADPELPVESRNASRLTAEALARMIELFSLDREVPRRQTQALVEFLRRDICATPPPGPRSTLWGPSTRRINQGPRACALPRGHKGPHEADGRTWTRRRSW